MLLPALTQRKQHYKPMVKTRQQQVDHCHCKIGIDTWKSIFCISLPGLLYEFTVTMWNNKLAIFWHNFHLSPCASLRMVCELHPCCMHIIHWSLFSQFNCWCLQSTIIIQILVVHVIIVFNSVLNFFSVPSISSALVLLCFLYQNQATGILKLAKWYT